MRSVQPTRFPAPLRSAASICALLVLWPLAGCVELPASARVRLNEAKANYDRHAYRAAVARLDDTLSQYPDHPDSAEAYYLRSLCHTKLSNKVRAESDARRCLELSKQPDLTANAHATLAILMYESNRTREALPHFAEALRSSQPRTNEDVLRYKYGLCLQREGRWKEARLEFAAVFQRFPNGTAAQHARRLYNWPHPFYSIQCGVFRRQADAEKLRSQLQRWGFRGRVESMTRTGELVHAVYVGQYSRYGQARDALPAVQRKIRDAFVVPQ